MRYYEVKRDAQGKYKVLIYKVLFSFLVPVFTGYTDSTKSVNDMLLFYKKRTGMQLYTAYSYRAGAGR